jgi:hypothetical protein
MPMPMPTQAPAKQQKKQLLPLVARPLLQS